MTLFCAWCLGLSRLCVPHLLDMLLCLRFLLPSESLVLGNLSAAELQGCKAASRRAQSQPCTGQCEPVRACCGKWAWLQHMRMRQLA